MKIVTNQKMEEIDKLAQEQYFLPAQCLMENAGLKAWQFLTKKYHLHGLIVFVAGKGNNGGDALVMARHCYLDGYQDLCIILAAGEPAPKTAPAVNLAACRALEIEIIDYEKEPELAHDYLQDASWLVDGIFGTGLKGELRTPVRDLVTALNACHAVRIAIDLPTGMGDEFKKDYVALQADSTLTMGLPKNCLYLPYARPLCGEIVIINPGFPPELLENGSIPGELLPAERFEELLPEIPATAYKTRRGHLAVFAGSVGTSGAAWLCSYAAARSRAGLVTLFADPELYPAVASSYHSVIVQRWDPQTGAASREQDLASLADYSAFLAGPGWGFTAEKENWLVKLLATDKPGVIDADALRMIALNREKKAYKPGPQRVLTPHPGEFSAFTNTSIEEILTDPLPAMQAICKELDTNIILKGHITYIMAPDGRYGVLDGMNPSLATGGSGDVLSGIIAGFLAQGMSAFEAACAGVMFHSYLGKIVYHEQGWFLAEDMLPYISAVLAGSEQGESEGEEGCGCHSEHEHHHE